MASRRQRARRHERRALHVKSLRIEGTAGKPVTPMARGTIVREQGQEERQQASGPRRPLTPARAPKKARRALRRAARAPQAPEPEVEETQVQAWARQAREGTDVVERAWRRTFRGIHQIGYKARGVPGKSGLQMVGDRPESARTEPQSVMNPGQRLNPSRRRRHRHRGF